MHYYSAVCDRRGGAFMPSGQNAMLISIIVPLYNVKSYVEDCLLSIARQTFDGACEVLVVNDASTDGSETLAQHLLDRMPSHMEGRMLQHDHNRGLSAARNTGLQSARGRYVLFVDSDDMLAPSCLEALYGAAESNGADMAYGGYGQFADENPSVVEVHNEPYVMAWNKLIRRDFIEARRLRFVEGLIHEDNPWRFALMVSEPRVVSVGEVTYLYRVRPGSLQTCPDHDRHYEAWCRILTEYGRILADLPLEKRARYVGELERQKALFFTMTAKWADRRKLRRLYGIIRQVGPHPACSKASFHYRLPACIGFAAYCKFHKYYLC